MLSKRIVELPVEELRLGLYVSKLDRPWEGTPFLFQGFAIENDQELTSLRELCKIVFVDVSVEEAAELEAAARRKRASAPKEPPRRDTLADLSRNVAARVATVPEKDAVELRVEIANAEKSYEEARGTVTQVFDRLRAGGGLDVPNLEGVVDSMVDSVFRNRDAMSWLARMKTMDDYLYSHSLAVSVWAMAFGRHLGLDKDTLRCVGTGAMLLDIGKTRLPAELLRKPGRPTDEEWITIRRHVDEGVALVQGDGKVDTRIVQMLATHHERHDGTGYPHGLEGEAIPLIGRIAGIVDCYDAMITERSYAKPKSAYDAVRELKGLGGTAFQPELVELFIQAVGVFPTGTLVELNTGEVGVVTGQNRFRRLRPEIMLILDPAKKLREDFTTIDLLTCPQNGDIDKPQLWISKGLQKGAYDIDPQEYFL